MGETEVATEPAGNSTDSYIDEQLLLYVASRGIPMPFYNKGSKIIEEAQELQDALVEHLANPTEATLAHVLEEIGDVVITAAVAARQVGVTVEDALAAKIAKDAGRGPKQ